MDVFLLLRVILEEHKDDIINANRQQLLRGEKADGKQLPPYTDAYAKLKNKPKRPKTLKDTGDFHAGFDANFFKDYYEAFSKDWKDDIMIHNWGNEIYGLNENSRKKIMPKIIEKLQSYITRRT